jgi:hypothetical protein
MTTTELPPTRVAVMPTGQSSGDSNLTSSQRTRVAQSKPAAGDQTSMDGHASCDTHWNPAVHGPILADPMLGMAAEVVDDLERVRIANENRYRTLTATGEFGFGLTDDHPDIARLRAMVDGLAQSEHQAILNLQRVMRNHPLGPWVKNAPGVGEKQAARLLAVVRDPYWNDLHDRPRTVSELWAYCGFHVINTPGSHSSNDAHWRTAAGPTCYPDSQRRTGPQCANAVGVAPKRQRGQKSNWNEDARKRAWLIAASCVKQPAGTPYRDIYDQTREKYAEATHSADCVRCGPSGKPAPAGSPLSAGHQHARAMRAIAKAVLKELWLEAKRIHELTGAADPSTTTTGCATTGSTSHPKK